MKFSAIFLNTLFEEPQEAEMISHRLMLRASLIQRLASGIFSYLPLGYRVLKKVIKIINEEMDNIGCQELLMPTLHPANIWQETGRWEAYGEEMFKLIDRKKSAFGLGPTHEEVITDIVRRIVSSHKQLPFRLYQIQTKFRDEPRPRCGMIRAREFIMKDAYSFHETSDDADSTYEDFYMAYKRIFNRCGFEFVAVKAESGLIGGSVSHEFIAPAEAGEDFIIKCNHCTYGASLDAALKGTQNQTIKNCPVCIEGELKYIRGIELGHTFKLGTKYSEGMKALFIDEAGIQHPIIMGCYGIGVSRIIPSIIEQQHDEKGIIWPAEIAPFDIMVLPINVKDENQRRLAFEIYESLKAECISVLIDDRDERPGRKFTDADLIGIPIQIIIGTHSKKDGKIEVSIRRDKSKHFIEFSQLCWTNIRKLEDKR